MTKIQETLQNLSDDQKKRFEPVFVNIDTFYKVVYTITRYEHLTEMQKEEHYEEKLKIMQQVRTKVEQLVTSYGFDGHEIVADISSDYFEDFVNYKDSETEMPHDEFIRIIKKISETKVK